MRAWSAEKYCTDDPRGAFSHLYYTAESVGRITLAMRFIRARVNSQLSKVTKEKKEINDLDRVWHEFVLIRFALMIREVFFRYYFIKLVN